MATKKQAAPAAPLTDEQHNAQHRIADFTVGKSRKQIHLLNAGQHFRRFGGSSHGLLVRKTASLIVREIDEAYGITDTEYDVNDKAVWDSIFSVATRAGYNPKKS